MMHFNRFVKVVYTYSQNVKIVDKIIQSRKKDEKIHHAKKKKFFRVPRPFPLLAAAVAHNLPDDEVASLHFGHGGIERQRFF